MILRDIFDIIRLLFRFINYTVISIFLFFFCLVFYFNFPQDRAQDKTFIINSNESFKEVVKNLHREEFIKNEKIFFYISQIIKGKNPKVKYGEYFFNRDDSYDEIMRKIQNGVFYFRRMTIIEGMSAHSVSKLLEDQIGLRGPAPKIKEGQILPETYFYLYGSSRSELVSRMKNSMQRVIDRLWESRDKSIPIKSKRDALILASIVEKESGNDFERPIIASVFMNRLNKGMRLQSDPTIIYSYAFGNKALERKIRSKDIRNKSKYNTYHIRGLPPHPICNPGEDSIRAVLNPAKTNFLYFVASGYGHHNFSSNLKQHNFYVKQYYDILRHKKNKKQ